MLNKIKQKLKNRKPMEPKRKALIKGLVFGFLAGGLATITAVGIVGCSMTQGESKQPKMLRADYTGTLNGTSWQINSTISAYSSALYIEVNFTSNNTNYGVFNVTKGGNLIYYPVGSPNGSQVYHKDQSNKWYFGEEYRNVTFTSSPTSLEADLRTWLNSNAVLISSGSSSSSEATTSSAATTSEPVATSSEDATISAPSSTSRAEGGAVTFNDRNPFSAWVVNPKSLERATSFDSGAPWLLYTGSPTDENSSHSTITTKYELYDVGAFHVYGNDGVTFDKIGITTQNLAADVALTLDGETATLVSAAMYEKGAFRITGIKYVNSQNDTSVDVYKETWSIVDNSGNSVYALSGGRWLNEGFRTIVLDDVDGNLTIHGYQASVGWWLENNALASSDAIATMVLGNSSTGVFGLIASAFGCWTSVFGLAIIPGLTIGTLIFVPLVVMIIVAIVKLLAK